MAGRDDEATLAVEAAAWDENEEAGASAALAFAGVAGCVFALFVAAVFAYANFSGPLVERLTSQVGEVMVKRARDLQDLGQTEQAILAYRRAFESPFEDKRQRGWALRSFGELLVDAQRPDEAIPVLEECLTSFPDDLRAHGLICRAQLYAKHYDALENAATRWREAAKTVKHAANQAEAVYYLGAAAEGRDDMDKALQLYLEGHALDPKGYNAFHAAKLLVKKGDKAKARQLLEAYIPNGTGWRLKAAQDLLGQLGAGS